MRNSSMGNVESEVISNKELTFEEKMATREKEVKDGLVEPPTAVATKEGGVFVRH